MKPIIAVAATCLALSACASSGNWMAGASIASGFQQKDVPVVAMSITKFVEMKIKPDAGGIVVERANGDADVGPAITEDLRADGYTVSDSGPNKLRYVVQPLDDQFLAMAFLNDDTVSTRLFSRNSAGALQAAGPYAIGDTK